MPKFEPKQVQKDLEKGILWPVYWLHGTERMKSRELLKRIRRTVFGTTEASEAEGTRNDILSFAEENLDGNEIDAAQVVDSAQSLSLGGGIRFVVVRDAHLLKDLEDLSPLLGPASYKDQLSSVCVFLSKDLDGRKKFSKVLVEKAAVVACEEVPEEEREAWIAYLSKRRGLNLDAPSVAQLRSLDPWTLEIIDQELEKFSLASSTESIDPSSVLLGSGSQGWKSDTFMEDFFQKRLQPALEAVDQFGDSPEESLPLLGLLAWNVRHLALVISDRDRGGKSVSLNPFLADRMNRWSKKWSGEQIIALQNSLAEIDFGMKQTAKLPLGLWAGLIQRHL